MKTLRAFTIAEILITLTILGIVAAITMPLINQKVNDMQYDRAREKVLMSIGEAGRLLAVQGEINSAVNAKDFVNNYLSKKLKITKMCESTDLKNCGLPQEIKTIDGNSVINMPQTGFQLGLTSNAIKDQPSYGFSTVNGYSVNLFYNPNCPSRSL